VPITIDWVQEEIARTLLRSHLGLFLPAPPYVLLPPPYNIWKYLFILLVSLPYSGLHNSEVNL